MTFRRCDVKIKTTKPIKVAVSIQMIKDRINKLDREIRKFDQLKVDAAGRRLRLALLEIQFLVLDLRLDIQRVRWYREANKIKDGKKTIGAVENLASKEKKYGTVAEVVEIQKSQGYEA